MNKNQDRERILLIVGIIFIAFNLRPAITSVGPLITAIQQHFNINNLEAGFLTTIPLLAFAVFSPFVAAISHRFGNAKTLFGALLLLTIGIAFRYTENIWSLYFGTLVIGSGIAIINVLLPSIIKSDFPKKIGLMTSVYTTAMCAMAGLASGISVPLAEGAGLGWKNTLAVWGLLAVVGILLWLPQLNKSYNGYNSGVGNLAVKSIWRDKTAWYISLFFGLQSFIFYCVIAWLPAILHDKGMSRQTAGWMLLFVQIIGLPATFFSPIIASKTKKLWTSIAAIFTMNMIGFAGLLSFQQPAWLVVSMATFGLSMGGSISLAYMVISTKAGNFRQAAQLSGMAQAVGYLLAATGPALLGFAYDQSGAWVYPLLIIQVVNILMFASGVRSVKSKAGLEG